MTQNELSELTDKELLEETKKIKSNAKVNALLVGFLVGIIIFSILKSSVGLFTLIPLYLAYKIANSSKNSKALDEELNARNLN